MEPSLDLALEQLVSILSVVSLLSIFQQVAGIELGAVQNKSLSFRICNLGRIPGTYVPKMCWAAHQHGK